MNLLEPHIFNASPLIGLAILDKLYLPGKIFKQWYIPKAVYKELTIIEKPFSDYFKTMLISQVKPTENTKACDYFSYTVDRGEAEVIQLALEQKYKYVVIDDYKGRRLAKDQGLKVKGLLGLLLIAKERGLLTNIKECINQLSQNGMRISDKLIDQVLILADED